MVLKSLCQMRPPPLFPAFSDRLEKRLRFKAEIRKPKADG
jgi:hypothetical protein